MPCILFSDDLSLYIEVSSHKIGLYFGTAGLLFLFTFFKYNRVRLVLYHITSLLGIFLDLSLRDLLFELNSHLLTLL